MFKYIRFLTIFLSAAMVSCQKKPNEKSLFEKGVAHGTNKNGKLEEASGLVESARQPGYFWVINDSGNPADIFLIDKQAKTKKVFHLTNIENRDWEDITISTEGNTSYLYIADIGDNNARYTYKYIYKIKEPSIEDDELISHVDKLTVKLEDKKRDSETLMFDPTSKNLYLISKRESNVIVYEIAHPFKVDTIIAKNIGALPFEFINGGAISPEGNELLLRTYTDIYYWKKKNNESIPDLLKTAAIELPYNREPQGESIAWARDSTGYYTLSENAKGERGKLYFYKRN